MYDLTHAFLPESLIHLYDQDTMQLTPLASRMEAVIYPAVDPSRRGMNLAACNYVSAVFARALHTCYVKYDKFEEPLQELLGEDVPLDQVQTVQQVLRFHRDRESDV